MKWWIAICLFTQLNAQAQEFVLVEKVGTIKRTRWAAGDKLTFKLRGNDTLFIDDILAVNDTAILFSNRAVPYRSIRQVARRKSSHLYPLFRTAGFIFGTGFIGLDVFNRITNRDRPIVAPAAVRISATSVGAASLLYLLEPRWYRMGKKWNIRYLDARPIVPNR
ncbi:MAG TPA: hypothetical protein VFV37_06740 [Luteibaculaceae bacterium]|nr:hypothetical protein [Luteibaculaceae bacterium]